MAYEATQVEGPYEVHDFTVSATTAFPKGTLCETESPRTALVSSSTGPFAGINVVEKTATDGSTELGLATNGIHLLWASSGAAITAGELVKLSGANLVGGTVVEADIIAGQVVGTALSDVTAATLEQIEVDIGKR